MTLAEDVPVRLTVAPLPPEPPIVPEIENVCGVEAVATKFIPVTLAAVIVAACEVGPNVKPV